MTYQPHQSEDTSLKTPAAEWRANGEPDPHGNRYDCERAELCMGFLSDDALANEAFLNYDYRPTPHQLIAGTHHMPIAYMTAVKDRIRWLSRALERERAANAALRRAMQPMDPAAARGVSEPGHHTFPQETPPIPEEPQSPTTTGGEKEHG